jgi:eukaryotic-like serine/threonine-protein kinase
LREQLQQTLGSAFTLERELGGGGMSRVFVAEETTLDRKVVIKVLLPALGAAVNLEQFRREIQLAAKLQHPNIVAVLASGATGRLPYYTMPFVEGESLRVRIAREGELPINDVVKILRDVLSALAYAHERGMVHRDIKPDNVLLTNYNAQVTDFGIAEALTASASAGSLLTSLGVALGTPAYMAPEQVIADPTADHRADLYSVGAMAYEMLTGNQVFGSRTAQATMAAHAIERPEPLDLKRPSVSPVLSGLVMRALEKNPADRPQSAAEMLSVLG